MTSSFRPPARGPSLFFAPFWKSRYAQNSRLTLPTNSVGNTLLVDGDTDPLRESPTAPLETEPTLSRPKTTDGQDARGKTEPSFTACAARPRIVSQQGPACHRTTGVYAKNCSAAGTPHASNGSRAEPSTKRAQQSSPDASSEEVRYLQELNPWAGLSSSETGGTILQRSTALSEVPTEYTGAGRAGFSLPAPSSVPPVYNSSSCGPVPYASGRCLKEGGMAQEHLQQRVDCTFDMRVHPLLLQDRPGGPLPLGGRGADLCMTNHTLLPLCMAGKDGATVGAPPKYDVSWEDASVWGARERELQARVVHLQATLAADQAKRQIEAALALNQCRPQQPVIITNTTEVGSTAQTAAVTAVPRSTTPKNGFMSTRTNEALARAAAWCEGFMGSKVSQWVLVGGSVWLVFWLRNRLQLAWRLQYIRKRNDASLLYRASCCIRSCLNSRTGRDVSLSFL